MRIASKTDATPRLGALQWVGPGLVWLLALTMTLSQPPLFGHDSGDGLPRLPMTNALIFSFLAMLLYSPLLVGLLASLIGAFRAIAAASHRQEFRALMDLGAPRRGLVRHQARLGLSHGAYASVMGTALGLGVTQARSDLGDQFNSSTLWMLLTIIGVSIASTTLAYSVVARWITATPSTAVPSRDPSLESGGTAPSATTNRRRRVRWPIVLAVIVAAWVLASRWVDISPFAPAWITYPWLAVSLVAFGLALPALVVWAGAKVGAWLSKLAGRALLHGGNAARIAGDGLTRPTPARAVAIGAVGLVLGGTLAIGVTLNALGARNDTVAAITPNLIISTAELPNRSSATGEMPAPTGWERTSLDPKLVAALEADERFIVIPAGILTVGVDSVDRPDGADRVTTPYLTVSPADLDRVSADASRALYFGGAAAMGGGPNPARLTLGGTSAEVAAPNVGGPFAALPRGWAESTFGAGGTSAVLLYDGPGGDAHSAIADYDLTGLHVQDLGKHGTGSGALNRVGVLTVSGSLLILAVGLVVALSLSVQRMRGHYYATMAALGASRSALRWGTAIESAVVTASGAVIGVALGGAWGMWLAVSANNVPWRLAWMGASFDINHAPWGTVLVLALASIAAAATASVIARARLERMTPTEQLREAIKEGAV